MTDNKAMIRRMFEEGFNQNRASVIDELIAPNYVNHDLPAPVPGPEGWKQVVGMFRAAFPDMKITLEDVFADGDKVGTRGFFTGTHKGEFMGVSATGKPVKMKYIDLWRVVDGKLVDNWVQMDMLGMMQQLGAVPAPERQ
jgi:predicted ester cyclase